MLETVAAGGVGCFLFMLEKMMGNWCHGKMFATGKDNIARRIIDASNHAGGSARGEFGAGVGEVLGGDG